MKKFFKYFFKTQESIREKVMEAVKDLRDVIVNSVTYYGEGYEGWWKGEKSEEEMIFPHLGIYRLANDPESIKEAKSCCLDFSLIKPKPKGESIEGKIKITESYTSVWFSYYRDNSSHPKNRIRISLTDPNPEEFITTLSEIKGIIKTSRQHETFYNKIFDYYEIPIDRRELALLIIESLDTREILNALVKEENNLIKKEKEILLFLPSMEEIEKVCKEDKKKAAEILRESFKNSILVGEYIKEMSDEELVEWFKEFSKWVEIERKFFGDVEKMIKYRLERKDGVINEFLRKYINQKLNL